LEFYTPQRKKKKKKEKEKKKKHNKIRKIQEKIVNKRKEQT